jgi:hypothetical protein
MVKMLKVTLNQQDVEKVISEYCREGWERSVERYTTYLDNLRKVFYNFTHRDPVYFNETTDFQPYFTIFVEALFKECILTFINYLCINYNSRLSNSCIAIV